MGRRETLMSQLRGEPPPTDDGRNVDSLLGLLEGEGAAQQVERLAEEHPHPPPSELHDSTSDLETYYGLPLLKEHVWKAAIPAYFYVGGLAGASAALGAGSILPASATEPVAAVVFDPEPHPNAFATVLYALYAELAWFH